MCGSVEENKTKPKGLCGLTRVRTALQITCNFSTQMCESIHYDRKSRYSLLGQRTESLLSSNHHFSFHYHIAVNDDAACSLVVRRIMMISFCSASQLYLDNRKNFGHTSLPYSIHLISDFSGTEQSFQTELSCHLRKHDSKERNIYPQDTCLTGSDETRKNRACITPNSKKGGRIPPPPSACPFGK